MANKLFKSGCDRFERFVGERMGAATVFGKQIIIGETNKQRKI